jgi:hypothetical protein
LIHQRRYLGYKLIYSFLPFFIYLRKGLDICLDFLLGQFFVSHLILQSGDGLGSQVLVPRFDDECCRLFHEGCTKGLESI